MDANDLDTLSSLAGSAGLAVLLFQQEKGMDELGLFVGNVT
jgi:hypothetical protein